MLKVELERATRIELAFSAWEAERYGRHVKAPKLIRAKKLAKISSGA